MEPNIWGPSAWIFLHTVTLQYPEKPTDDDKKKYYVFFNSLKDILPCPNCKIHYSESITKKPIQLESRKELFEWLIDIHIPIFSTFHPSNNPFFTLLQVNTKLN